MEFSVDYSEKTRTLEHEIFKQKERLEAAEALEKIGEPAVEPLLTALKTRNYRVRMGAAIALGKVGQHRLWAARAIGKTGDKRAGNLSQ